jgi:hypothetical protein
MPSSDAVVMDITSDARKMVAAAKERNLLAMANLKMAFQTKNSIWLDLQDHEQ